MLTNNSISFAPSLSGLGLNPASSSLLPPTAPVSALLVRIQEIVCEQVRMLTGMQITLIAIGLLLNALIVGLGIYLSSYLKKKAQNLATREEFKELQKQTAALTRTTAQIEADIKASQWDRQKRWELKREVLFEAARRVAAVHDALRNLNNGLQTKLKNPSLNEGVWDQFKVDENAKWFQLKSALDESRLFVGVTCGENVAETLEKYNGITTKVAALIYNNDGEIYRKSLSEMIALNDAIRDAIRKELGLSIGESGKDC
jgi:hypothetical protein